MAMGAIQTPCSSVEQLLGDKAAAVRQCVKKGQKSIGELTVRRFPTRLEPESYIPADADMPFERVRFRLVMSNSREEWKITMDMIFHTRKRLLEDGSMADPGLQFNVVDENGKSLFIDYMSAEPSEELEHLSGAQWSMFWFRKITRRPEFSSVFAYKEFVRELDD